MILLKHGELRVRHRRRQTKILICRIDEQFYEMIDDIKGLMCNRNNKVEEFNKLNEVFSERVKDISGKTDGSKGRDKEIVTDSDNLNVNNKRVAKVQGARDDSNSE